MTHQKPGFDVLRRITEERQKRNWSEYTLSKNSGIPQSTISSWYRKEMVPSVSSIEKICNGLGISLSQFFSTGSSTDQYFTEEQQEIFTFWKRLTPKQRDSIRQMFSAFLDDNGEDNEAIIP